MPFDLPHMTKLEEIEQEILPVLTYDDPLFDIFPIENEDTVSIRWEQMDDFFGLMNVRGINGQPGRVKRVGTKMWEMDPGYYGDFQGLDEKELTERRRPGTWDEPIDIDDLVVPAMNHLLSREVNRIRKILADLLTTATFSVFEEVTGALLHTDSFPITPITPAVPWSTLATAIPLSNIRTAVAGKLGYSYDFGKEAIMLMNQNTYNVLASNTNTSDLAGKRAEYGMTYHNLASINSIFMGDNLPQILIYNESYKTTSSATPTLLIPDGKVVIVGKRKTGRALGNFTITRNAQNPDLGPKQYMWIVDPFSMAQGNILPGGSVPRTIEIHRGFNGGPKLQYPNGIIIFNAY